MWVAVRIMQDGVVDVWGPFSTEKTAQEYADMNKHLRLVVQKCRYKWDNESS